MNPASRNSNRRLESWKEIAAFFHRDERTVRRWEKERSLPVYRMPGKARSSVYAFEDELARWLRVPNPGQAASGEKADSASMVRVEASPQAKPRSSRKLTKLMIFTAAALAACVLAAFRLIHPHAPSVGGTRDATGIHRPTSAEAQDLYLKGRYEWSRRSPESLTRAVDYFTQAIVRDPDYALAYAGLADTYNLLREYTTMPAGEAYPRALAAAKKAVELDDTLSDAHRSLAFASFYWSWDFSGAEREFKRAIELSPNDAVGHHWYATALMVLGRFSESLAEIDRARQLDPSSASILADRGLILFTAQRSDEAVSLLKQIETTDPEFLSPHAYLAEISLDIGDYPAYLAETSEAAALMHNEVKLEIAKAGENGLSQSGGKGLLEAVRKMEQHYFKEGRISGYHLAKLCALSGHDEEALQYLQDAFQRHDSEVLGLRVDAAFRNLRGEAAFHNLISQIGLPPSPLGS